MHQADENANDSTHMNAWLREVPPLSQSKPLPDIGEIQSNIKNDAADSGQEEMVGSLMGSCVVFLVCID